MKHTINLLQPELIADKPLMTLKNVVLAWVIALVITGSLTFTSQVQVQKLASERMKLNRQNQNYTNQVAELQNQLAGHKADTKLVAELDMLKGLIKNKNYLHGHLTDTKSSYIGGFAQAMDEISNLHSSDVSLEHIWINESAVSFSGVARSADAVPDWLANFERSTILSGKLFEHFSLVETEQKLISFTVSSNELASMKNATSEGE